MAALVLCLSASARAGQSTKVDVTGEWAFTVESGAGTGAPTVTLKQVHTSLDRVASLAAPAFFWSSSV
jgi:hypothetical protein